MIKQILDLHIHSRYSRACSKNLSLPSIAEACEIRGVDIVATGDFTHPAWFEHIKESLVEVSDGIFEIKEKRRKDAKEIKKLKTKFILGTELSCIKKDQGKTRRLHLCVFAPNLAVAEKFNNTLVEMGFNLRSDGRPILGLTARELLQIMLDVDERLYMVPAHIWTPWFGLFGSKGGYDSLDEAFGDLKKHIFAVETGLSSDPPMNWRVSELDDLTLVSNSDAHSTAKIGREANVLQFSDTKQITYDSIFEKIKTKKDFLYTIEFYPEEGKYHYDGHRDCEFFCDPIQTAKLKGICPKCKKPLVIGVENRIYELGDRNDAELKKITKQKIPFKSLVPLPEILADLYGCGVNTKKVNNKYDEMIADLGNEFSILLDLPIKEIDKKAGADVARAIDKVRRGDIFVRPGYDGEFGRVKVFAGDDKYKMKQLK